MASENKKVYTQADVIDHLVEKLSEKDIKTTKKDTKIYLDTLQDVIGEILSEATEDTSIEVKIGKALGFVGAMRAEREGRNPSTGETMTIPASITVRAKATKTFKDLVNQA